MADRIGLLGSIPGPFIETTCCFIAQLTRVKCDVAKRWTALSRRHLYYLMSEGSFPRPIELGKRSVAWPESEVDDWLKAKIAARDQAVAA